MKILFATSLLFLSIAGYSQKYRPNLLIPYSVNKIWGYSDTSGNIKIKPSYDSTCFFEYDSHAKVFLNKKQSYIDTAGKLLLPFFDAVSYLRRNTYIVSDSNLYGIYYNGKLSVPIEYEEFISTKNFPPYNETAYNIVGLKDDKYYIISFTNNEVIKTKYEREKKKNATDLTVAVQAPFYNMDKQVNILVTPQPASKTKSAILDSIRTALKLDSITVHPLGNYDRNGRYWESYYKLYKNKKVGLSYKSFTILPNYQKVGNVYEDGKIQIFVCKKNKWGVVNEKDETLIPVKFDSIKIETSEVFITTLKNKKGAVTFTPYYTELSNKFDKLALARRLSKGDYDVNFFHVFKIELNGTVGYVGENGIEYYIH